MLLETLLIVVTLTGCSKDDSVFSEIPQQTEINDKRIAYKQYTTSFSYWNSKGVDINYPLLVDYNGNKKYDIIVSQRRANRVGNSYTYELLNPIAILDDNSKIELTNMWKGGGPVTIGDFNGDGYVDVAEFDNGHEFYDLEETPDKTNLLVWWNSQSGFTGNSTFVDSILHNSYALSAADLDGDGKDELVRMDFPYHDNYFKFDGTKFNKIPINGLPNITNSGLFFSDLDGDKKMDAISSAYGSPTIIWNFLNNTNKTKLEIPKGYGINNTVAADFDGDGYKDIIFICQKEDVGGQVFENKHFFFYYKNDGNNSYNLVVDILPEYVGYTQPNSPLFVSKDLDGDGDLDFYNVNTDYDEIFINTKGKFKRFNKLGYEL